MKKFISVFLAVSLIITMVAPCLLAAGYTKAQLAQYWTGVCKAAQKDAEKDTNTMLWVGAGCLITWIGLLLAYFITPSLPEERLVGKNSAYVSQYTKCYTAKARDLMTGNAWLGCGIGAGVEVVIMIVYFVIFANAVKSIPQ
jgi:hypothetical protein